jgi:hypothetical protein
MKFFEALFCVIIIIAGLTWSHQYKTEIRHFMWGPPQAREVRIIRTGFVTDNSVMNEPRTFNKRVQTGKTYQVFYVYKGQHVYFSSNADVKIGINLLNGNTATFYDLRANCRGSSCQMHRTGMLEIIPNKSAAITIKRGDVNPYLVD